MDGLNFINNENTVIEKYNFIEFVSFIGTFNNVIINRYKLCMYGLILHPKLISFIHKSINQSFAQVSLVLDQLEV
jgi:hypothetical protein